MSSASCEDFHRHRSLLSAVLSSGAAPGASGASSSACACDGASAASADAFAGTSSSAGAGGAGTSAPTPPRAERVGVGRVSWLCRMATSAASSAAIMSLTRCASKKSSASRCFCFSACSSASRALWRDTCTATGTRFAFGGGVGARAAQGAPPAASPAPSSLDMSSSKMEGAGRLDPAAAVACSPTGPSSSSRAPISLSKARPPSSSSSSSSSSLASTSMAAPASEAAPASATFSRGG
mmetsp:Transcript_27431/g.81691  ORF Transcript_27431/g.81691 Transcript_27431/m.81691 type:complete len:238 (+) Transcript_27431:2176-2889(+)